VKSPDLAIIYLKVMDSDAGIDNDDFVGYSAIPVTCVSPGYRHLDVYNAHGYRDGKFAFARLFVRISFEEL
jgi:hypothetical protein